MEHTWRILEEKVLTDHLGENGVIAIIWFRLTTTEGEKLVKTDGRVSLPIDDLTGFVPYAQVDLQLKTDWIKAHAGDFYENLNIEKLAAV